MKSIAIDKARKKEFNALVTHPLQSYEWGEFREKTGVRVIRRGLEENGKLTTAMQLTLHPIPHLPLTIGYLPKGQVPTQEIITELKTLGEKEKMIFLQLEPNVVKSQKDGTLGFGHGNVIPSFHPLFTKFTFILDIDKSEEELLKNMHPKTRYNIRVAEKHGVEIVEDNSDEAFELYWQLTQETTKRQGFYAHTKAYHKLQWQTLNVSKNKTNDLTSHLFLAKYQGKVLAAWILFVFHDTLYYPYGSSSTQNREVMASNLMMWTVIQFGKKRKLKKFDMWGALGEEPDTKDPWYGFHRFKQGYGAVLTEYLGSFDLVINPFLYQGYKVADKVRWLLLKARA